MGTNYYWKPEYIIGLGQKDPLSDEDPKVHIGKSSAAGPYCWDCGVTLNMGGSREVHYGKYAWYDACPICGCTTKKTEALGESLGPKEGVQSCLSFLWTAMGHKHRIMAMAADPNSILISETGQEFTAQEFIENVLDGVAMESQYAGHFS